MFLNCHSFHSLRYGTISIDELVRQAHENKVKTLALTDINTVTGIYDFLKACKSEGIKAVAGVDIRIDNEQYYIAVANNLTGLGALTECLLSTTVKAHQ